MCRLAQCGLVHACISEDSDLIAFGCDRILFKMDSQGNGKQLELADIQVRYIGVQT